MRRPCRDALVALAADDLVCRAGAGSQRPRLATTVRVQRRARMVRQRSERATGQSEGVSLSYFLRVLTVPPFAPDSDAGNAAHSCSTVSHSWSTLRSSDAMRSPSTLDGD